MNTTDLRRAADLLDWLEEQTSTTWSMPAYLRFHPVKAPFNAVIGAETPPIEDICLGKPVFDACEWGAYVAGEDGGVHGTGETPREALKSAVETLQRKGGEVPEALEGIE